MIHLVFITIITLSGVAFLIGCFLGVYQYLTPEPITNTPITELSIPKTQYVRLVVDWCHTNIKHPNTVKPTVIIKYHPNKKYSGIYFSRSNQMVVYVNNHDTIGKLTNTTIHEYVHARQRNRSFDKLYDRYTKEKGYWDNPFEIESRTVSSENELRCVKHLTNTYQILK